MNYFSTNSLILHILKFLVVKPSFIIIINPINLKIIPNLVFSLIIQVILLVIKFLDVSTNSIITARDVYFLADIPGTINTTLFCNKCINTIINFKD